MEKIRAILRMVEKSGYIKGNQTGYGGLASLRTGNETSRNRTPNNPSLRRHGLVFFSRVHHRYEPRLANAQTRTIWLYLYDNFCNVRSRSRSNSDPCCPWAGILALFRDPASITALRSFVRTQIRRNRFRSIDRNKFRRLICNASITRESRCDSKPFDRPSVSETHLPSDRRLRSSYTKVGVERTVLESGVSVGGGELMVQHASIGKRRSASRHGEQWGKDHRKDREPATESIRTDEEGEFVRRR